MKYKIEYQISAIKQLKKLEKSGKKTDLKRIETFVYEIQTNPRIGTGKPKRLKYRTGEVWSRRINDKDRFVYEIFEDKILVEIQSLLGHYKDK